MKTSHIALALLLALGAAPMIGCGDSDNDNSSQTGTNPGTDPGTNPGNPGELTRSVKSDKARAESKISDADLKDFVKGQYDLNYEIMRESGDDIVKKNAMISTYSIQTALAMVWAGADGETASEMKSVLHFNDHAHEALNKIDKTIMGLNKPALDSEYEKADAIEVSTANDLYLSPGHKWAAAWLDELAANYGAGVTEMNFAADPEKARQYINDAVSNVTHERIKDLIPAGAILENTQSVITNAIYFKAPWNNEVTKSEEKLNFNKADGSKVQVDMLVNAGHLEYVQGDNYQAVVESLRDSAFKVMFILPEEGQFDSVMASMNGEKVLGIFDALKTDKTIRLKFPVYQFTTSLSVEEPLMKLGMKLPFGGDADFSKMTEDNNELYISKILHKSFIGVDEKGVEAAAATAVMMQEGAMPMPENIIDVTLDRAFMFIIYESETRTPLFVGHVMDPSAN